MSMRILSITLLLLSCLCALSAGNLRHPGKKIYTPCCNHVTTLNISSVITRESHYRHQPAKGLCVEAIILRNSDGKVCADPKAQWVKNLISEMTRENP